MQPIKGSMIMIRTGRIAALFQILLLMIPLNASGAKVRVTWNPAAVHRGAVVPLRVEFPGDLYRVEAVVGGERFPLIPSPQGGQVALVGIDLDHQGDTLPVLFRLRPYGSREPRDLVAELRIREKEFTSQSLSLPTGMVDLDREKQRRASRDSARTKEALRARAKERYWSAGFARPAEGRVSTFFGTARVLNRVPRSPHRGVDIAAPRGSPVKSANSGVVTLVGDLFLSGRTVVVDHGWGVSTLYAHLDTITVREGQFVRRGELLGTVGSTGRATGPHLHFGAFIRGANVDPLQLIRATAGF